jgi:uncharacterized membrane protein
LAWRETISSAVLFSTFLSLFPTSFFRLCILMYTIARAASCSWQRGSFRSTL